MKFDPIACAITAAIALAAGQAAAAPPAAEAFGRLPALQAARISPDGKHIAALTEVGGKRVLSISEIDAGKVTALTLGDVVTRDIRWAGDDDVLVLVSYYVADPRTPKTPAHFERWVSVGLDATVRGRLGVDGDVNDYIPTLPLLGVTRTAKPLAVMSGAYDSASGGLVSAIYKVDVTTAKTASIADRGNDGTVGWSVDLDGGARVRTDLNDTKHEYVLMARRKGADGWKVIQHSNDQDDIGSYLGYSDPDDALFIAVTRPDGTGAIERHDLASGVTTLMTGAKPAASLDLFWDDNRMTPAAMVRTEGRAQYDWLDSSLGAIHDKLSHAFKDEDVRLVNWSLDRTRFVVEVQSGDRPPVDYLLDLAKKSLSPLGEAYPELKDAALGRRQWITYKARDGLEVPAYVTLPPGAPAQGGKLPLVVMPHGGPGARDEPDFDWWAQFVASRGYVVLQPQFRGSSGFGRAFQDAGEKAWSEGMQTDLLDGIDELARRGLVDPKRVCIVGWSYGGYAALAGETLHPDAYRCAASINGVSDVGAFVNQQKRVTGGTDNGDIRYWRRQVGWGWGKTASPANLADKAGGPILLVHAKQDTTVDFAQSQKMFSALKGRDKAVELVTLEGDDHQLSQAQSRIRMLKALDSFLARNLPVAP